MSHTLLAGTDSPVGLWTTSGAGVPPRAEGANGQDTGVSITRGPRCGRAFSRTEAVRGMCVSAV
ncbi:hypothetical protein GCM10027072_37540 [Streptomyces bullii]